MPELPEVETALRGISPYLQGAKIERIIVRQPKLRWAVSPELSQLHDEPILALSRRAKYLIIHTPKGYIIGHLGMSGSLRLVSGDPSVDKHDHIDIVLSNGMRLRYNDPRRFGAWLWADNLDTFHLFLKLGPEPLSEEFNGDYLFKKSRGKTTALKAFLMNNSVVVGVGNIYANESLFIAGLHPLKLAGKLTKAQCEKLVVAVKTVLQTAIICGGTTLKDFLQPNGRPGYFAQELQIYGKKNGQCPRCGGKIKSEVIGQRNSFYCPKCQKQ